MIYTYIRELAFSSKQRHSLDDIVPGRYFRGGGEGNIMGEQNDQGWNELIVAYRRKYIVVINSEAIRNNMQMR